MKLMNEKYFHFIVVFVDTKKMPHVLNINKKVNFNEDKYYILVLILFYIGFIIDSIKVISPSVNLYLVYSCLSISAIDCDQSMSLLDVKF